MSTTRDSAPVKTTSIISASIKRRLDNVKEEFKEIGHNLSSAVSTSSAHPSLIPQEISFKRALVEELNGRLSDHIYTTTQHSIDKLYVDWERNRQYNIEGVKEVQSTSVKFNEMGRNYLELNDKLEQIKQNLTILPDINVDYCVSRLSH